MMISVIVADVDRTSDERHSTAVKILIPKRCDAILYACVSVNTKIKIKPKGLHSILRYRSTYSNKFKSRIVTVLACGKAKTHKRLKERLFN